MTQREDKEKEKTARETLGKYFYDMSKLIFTAVVLTNITALVTTQHPQGMSSYLTVLRQQV